MGQTSATYMILNLKGEFKMKKHIIALILVATLLFSLNINAFASTSTTDTFLLNAITMVLQGMASEPDLYDLQITDFEGLSLGLKLPAYELTNGIPVQITSIEYYPLISDGDVKAIAAVTYSENNIPVAQISKSFASELSDNITNNPIALIFAKEGLYIWDGYTFTMLLPASIQYTDRSSIETCSVENFSAIMKQSVVTDIGITLNNVPQTFATQKYLTVPKVKQNATYSCWAACVKSIAGYYGITKSIDEIYNIANVTKYNGADITKVWDVLEASPFYFSCESEYAGGSSCLAFETLQYYIDQGYPLYGSVVYIEGTSGFSPGHAVVVRGYYNYTNTSAYAGSISYMNPYTGQYEASNVLTSGARPYIFTDQMGVELANIVDFLVVMD